MNGALRVQALRVDGFRNLDNLEIFPGPHANVFVGANGQGKTALLEAVDYVATLRSFRGATRAQLIGHEATRAEIGMRVEGLEVPAEFRVRLERTTREATVDGKRPTRAVDYYGRAACVVFHPEDLALIRGAPDVRRRLLDRMLVRITDGYGEALRAYVRALKSRNAVLRATPVDDRALVAFDPVLARFGSAIVRARTELTLNLIPAARAATEQIALAGPTLSMAYRTRTPDTADDYAVMLRESRANDLARRATSVGPHADDLAILWGRRPARVVASQGQTRALSLALRLAELNVLHDRTGRVPWLLLDDVSSELDRPRTERLFAFVATLGAQVWVTTTDDGVAALLPTAQRYRVHQGTVQRAP